MISHTVAFRISKRVWHTRHIHTERLTDGLLRRVSLLTTALRFKTPYQVLNSLNTRLPNAVSCAHKHKPSCNNHQAFILELNMYYKLNRAVCFEETSTACRSLGKILQWSEQHRMNACDCVRMWIMVQYESSSPHERLIQTCKQWDVQSAI